MLKYEGEIDKILMKWDTPTGVNKMVDVVNMTEKLQGLKESCHKRTAELKVFQDKLLKQLK